MKGDRIAHTGAGRRRRSEMESSMTQAANARVRPLWRSAMLACAGVLGTAVVVVGQHNSTVPQPRADRLPAPGPASPKPSRGVPRADGMLPTVPAGFTVTSYAEL